MHTLIVKAAAQIRFALDIDDARFAESHRCRNSDRFAERIAADFQTLSPLTWPARVPGSVDEHKILFDQFADFSFEQIVPVDLCVQRAANVLGGDDGSHPSFAA